MLTEKTEQIWSKHEIEKPPMCLQRCLLATLTNLDVSFASIASVPHTSLKTY